MHLITRSCVLLLWMHTLAFVKSKDCTLEQFLNSRHFDSNFDTTTLEARYPGGKQVRVGCNVGFSGFFKITCVEGQWEPRGTKCQPRSCGHPGDAQFADFHLNKGDDFVFGSEVVYTCHKGYQMVSRSNLRRCMAEGWDGVVPVCEAQQCPVIHVNDNVQVNGDPEEATYGNVVRFSCKSSTEILYGPAELYCDENGNWNGEAPKCKAVKCAVPEIENGYLTGDDREYNEHEVLYFACRSRYTRTEERPSKCTKVGTKAEWIPTPACELITCNLQLPALEGTSYEPASQSRFSPGETIRVSCGEKYFVSQHQYRYIETTCKDDGGWTIEPVCKEIICNDPRDPRVKNWGGRWWQQIKLGDTVAYDCKYGYKRTDGVRSATCTRDRWTPKPLCQEIICYIEDIENADVDNISKQRYRYREVASYTCKDGFKGQPTRTCEHNGWTGRTKCKEVKCNRLDIPNADITSDVKWEYNYLEEITYNCKEGYVGSPTRICGRDGWIGDSHCTEIQCEHLDIPHAYISNNNRRLYSHGGEVEYTCKNHPEDHFTVTCNLGNWTGIESCSACSKPSIQNGFVVFVPANETVYYSCNGDYKLFTKDWWGEARCVDNRWSRIRQCIGKNQCGEIPTIPNGDVTPSNRVYNPGQSIRITCMQGYQPRFDHLSRLTCEDGTWSPNITTLQTICQSTADHCGPPPKVPNAVVEGSGLTEYLSDTEVTYLCRKNYMMVGESKIKCKDGKWEEKNIECTQYCDRLKDERRTMNITMDEERFMDGHVIYFKCILTDGQTTGTATCINGQWLKTVDCEAPDQDKRVAADAGDPMWFN